MYVMYIIHIYIYTYIYILKSFCGNMFVVYFHLKFLHKYSYYLRIVIKQLKHMGERKPKSFKNKTCLSLIVTFIPTYKELKLCMGNRTCTKMLQSSKILCLRW